MAAVGDSKALGGELKLAPPPPYSGSVENWEEWSWQLKSYVSLFEPHIAKSLESVEGKSDAIDDKYLEDCEKNNNPRVALEQSKRVPWNLIMISKQFQYLLAQLTHDAAKLTVRLNLDGNGFETWKEFYERVSLPSRARSVSYLSRIIDHRLRDSQFETDLQEFMTLEIKNEKATGKKLDDDLLVTLLMAETQGPLQQHLRLNVDPSYLTKYCKRFVFGIRQDILQEGDCAPNGPAPMEIDQIGAVRGKKARKGYGKGMKGKGNWRKGFWTKGFGKGK